MANYYYISDGAGVRGPFGMDQIQSMWAAGQITATALYCLEGSEAWKSIESLRLGEKTAKHAYFSLSGLGLFDLIPGIRKLPYFVRFALMVIAVLVLCFVLLPKVFQRDDRRSAESPTLISGSPPSVQLALCFAAILAPLSEGASTCDSATISKILSSLQADEASATDVDKGIYSTATDIALLLQDALEKRNKHLEKSAAVGGDALSDSDNAHLQVAVDISWQRNVYTVRSQIRNLFLRLLRLEGGRFRSDSASASDIGS